MVEAPGTAPGSAMLIPNSVYRHSRLPDGPNIVRENRLGKGEGGRELNAGKDGGPSGYKAQAPHITTKRGFLHADYWIPAFAGVTAGQIRNLSFPRRRESSLFLIRTSSSLRSGCALVIPAQAGSQSDLKRTKRRFRVGLPHPG